MTIRIRTSAVRSTVRHIFCSSHRCCIFSDHHLMVHFVIGLFLTVIPARSPRTCQIALLSCHTGVQVKMPVSPHVRCLTKCSMSLETSVAAHSWYVSASYTYLLQGPTAAEIWRDSYSTTWPMSPSSTKSPHDFHISDRCAFHVPGEVPRGHVRPSCQDWIAQTRCLGRPIRTAPAETLQWPRLEPKVVEELAEARN